MLVIRVETGGYADYRRLARFHYVPGKPATVCRVVRAVARVGRTAVSPEARSDAPADAGMPAVLAPDEELAGVAVLSYPVACCAERNRVFGTGRCGLGANLAWANANVRTLSRLIVHPKYRGLGVATRLVRAALAACPTPWLETRSRLATAVPYFASAGLTRGPELGEGRPAYYYARAGAMHA